MDRVCESVGGVIPEGEVHAEVVFAGFVVV